MRSALQHQVLRLFDRSNQAVMNISPSWTLQWRILTTTLNQNILTLYTQLITHRVYMQHIVSPRIRSRLSSLLRDKDLSNDSNRLEYFRILMLGFHIDRSNHISDGIALFNKFQNFVSQLGMKDVLKTMVQKMLKQCRNRLVRIISQESMNIADAYFASCFSHRISSDVQRTKLHELQGASIELGIEMQEIERHHSI